MCLNISEYGSAVDENQRRIPGVLGFHASIKPFMPGFKGEAWRSAWDSPKVWGERWTKTIHKNMGGRWEKSPPKTEFHDIFSGNLESSYHTMSTVLQTRMWFYKRCYLHMFASLIALSLLRYCWQRCRIRPVSALIHVVRWSGTALHYVFL